MTIPDQAACVNVEVVEVWRKGQRFESVRWVPSKRVLRRASLAQHGEQAKRVEPFRSCLFSNKIIQKKQTRKDCLSARR